MTRIEHIKCPKCGSPVFSKEIDGVILCDSCGTMHARDEAVEIVGFEVGQFTRPGNGDRAYLPVWVIGVQYRINDISTQGGGVTNLFGLLPAQARDGTITMYVPAFEPEPARFKDMAMRMTASPPKYTAYRLEPGVKRLPCLVTAGQLENMAEFLFVTSVAEKPGVLQRLDYTLSVTSKRLLYLPYFKKGEELQPGY
jgi:hypothetical protein